MTDAMAKLEPMPPNDVPRPHPEKIFPVSWDQFHRDLRALAWRLAGGRAFEAIVCITRGGLVPAAIVARELGIRLIETVCVSSYDHTTQGNLIVLKEVAPAIVARGGGDGGSVLIVDDLVDTGQTAKSCAGSCRARTSPPFTPSPWAGRWSTPSSPRCRRTPGSIFPGIPGSLSSRRSARPACSASTAAIGYHGANVRTDQRRRPPMEAVAAKAERSVKGSGQGRGREGVAKNTRHDTADTHSHLVRPADMEWKKTRFPGCEVKPLLVDKESGVVTALMRFAPGAVLPDHEHVRIEQTYVIEGKLVDKEGAATGLSVGPGEFVWREAGSRHVAWTPEGGLMLAMFQVPNKFFERDGRITDISGADWESLWGGVVGE